jgi:putative PIN family toxin of toxin-antitoxin system
VLRAVLDTQVILRGATPPSTSITAQIYTAWDAGQFELLLSDPIVHEVGNVLGRPEVLRKLRMTSIEAAALLELLRRRGTWVTPTISIRQSRDPDDDKFLECAVAGGADYVVSADTDLLSLREVQGIPIVDAPTFWQQLRRQAERHE